MSAVAVLVGLVLLVWSADRFVSGAAALATLRGMPPLLVGMVIVGFGTSAPELTVSVLAASEGATTLALGNAWGSNIVNIALILGLTAVIAPISVHSGVLRREMPVLLAVTGLTVLLCLNLSLGRVEGILLLVVFAGLLGWSLREARTHPGDPLEEGAPEVQMGQRAALVWTLVGLVLLVAASRLLVWGAVRLAEGFGVSELVIGLTVVAIGTSLPELASSLAAIRRNAHDLALGNVLGSNLFNSLAVVGLATTIAPTEFPVSVLWRDLSVMTALTVALAVACFPLTKARPGRLNRFEGGAFVAVWAGYTAWLITTGS